MGYQNQGVEKTLEMIQQRRESQSGGGAYSGTKFEELISTYRAQNSGAKYTDALAWVMKNHPAAHADYLRRKNPGRDIGGN